MTLTAVRKYVTGVLLEWKPDINLNFSSQELLDDIEEIKTSVHIPPEISINITESETNSDILEILTGYENASSLKFSEQEIEDDIEEIKE